MKLTGRVFPSSASVIRTLSDLDPFLRIRSNAPAVSALGVLSALGVDSECFVLLKYRAAFSLKLFLVIICDKGTIVCFIPGENQAAKCVFFQGAVSKKRFRLCVCNSY